MKKRTTTVALNMAIVKANGVLIHPRSMKATRTVSAVKTKRQETTAR